VQFGHGGRQCGPCRREAEAGRDDDAGPAPLQRVRHLLAQDAVELFRRHAGPRHDAAALQEGRRTHHQGGVDATLPHAFEQQRNVEHHQFLARESGTPQEGTLPSMDQRMHDRFQPAQRLLVAEDAGAQGLTIEHAGLHDAGKRRLDAGQRRAARCLQGVDGGIGVVHGHAHLPQHLRCGRFAHADRAGQPDDDHLRRRLQQGQGTRTVWPVVLRLSRSICACAASASG